MLNINQSTYIRYIFFHMTYKQKVKFKKEIFMLSINWIFFFRTKSKKADKNLVRENYNL